MKKMYKKLVLKAIILTSIFAIFPFMSKNYNSVYAAPLSSEEMMQKEIDNLRKENRELREKHSEVDKELGKKYFEIDKEVYKIKTIASIIVSIVSILLGGGVGLSIYKIYEVKKEIDKKVEIEVNKKVKMEVNKKVPQEVKNKVAEKVGEETKHVKLMIDDLKKEEKFMNETKIVVISHNDEEEKEAKTLLKQFKRIEFIKLDYALDNLEKLRGYEVIFFNDINAYIKDEDMKKIIDNNNDDKTVYFYFNKRNKINPKQNKIFNHNGNENINFAKSNATLCGNLLDLIRYQENILKNRN
ncbi:hypothetical protein G8S21_07200 [Clostridium botulinum C]|uniref:NARF domain-containing protein n=1 Tax=Clostridium botulinum TaxID=1491 RepID=UPI001E42D422|nr:NARF domain-containing protein [Clostridium botulinum]MCD3245731.1 hypothetical protein [Clostridium botulinum C]MCD3262225.1 hypothetical protein [Clostridium botulinum C]